MSEHLGLTETLARYVEEHTRESAIAKKLRLQTAKMPRGGMQTMPDQIAFLALLVRLTGARRIVEIGTFTGYSALGMAAAMPPGGKLIACDASEEWTRIARQYWQEAGVSDHIDLRLGPALQTLESLLKEGWKENVDLVFIDADKTAYDGYYEAALKLLRKGGLVAFDNMLWGGSVADAKQQDADTKALRVLNAKIRDDSRVETCLLTLADGMALALKR